MFISREQIRENGWAAFERIICRLVEAQGFTGARLVGQSNDHGADIIASRNGNRWLFQAKDWKKTVGIKVIDETLKAAKIYKAKVPVIVASNGFEDLAYSHQQELLKNNINIQLWGMDELIRQCSKLGDDVPNKYLPRAYQEKAIVALLTAHQRKINRAMAVLATGMGKTFIAGDTVHRLCNQNPNLKILVLAHTNQLVYQLEHAFWKFMTKKQTSLIWNGNEATPSDLQFINANFVFACVNSVAEYISRGNELPQFDIVIVDECHHAGSQMYQMVLSETNAGKSNGPFLIGLTATPWRPDEINLSSIFGDTVVCIDMVEGLKNGFLANVDYRMYTDNIDWETLKNFNGKSFSPREINRTLFINQWDDAVVYQIRSVWHEQKKPRAIVFCGNIDHANIMKNKLNALGFCRAEAIYSSSGSTYKMSQFEKNRILADFSDGVIDVICAVDIFNEGLDVPDVNILVFQRVTHSRRIFIQQLGRGLRIAEDKDKVIVLDFVSDIRRFAAGIKLKDDLEEPKTRGATTRIDLPNKVTFKNSTGDDPKSEIFLRNWLKDIEAIENADEDASVLSFPPVFLDSKR